MEKELSKEQALSIIEQVVNLSVGKNVFKAEESATIFAALITIKNLLKESEEIKEEVKEEVKAPTKKAK